MNITLPPAWEQFIRELIDSGEYSAPDEVVRDALHLFQERHEFRKYRLERLRQDIQIGIDQLDRGECSSYSDETLSELIERIKTEGRERLRESETPEAVVT